MICREIFSALLLILVFVSGCMPASVSASDNYGTIEASARFFDIEVNGQLASESGAFFSYANNDIELVLQIGQQSVHYTLTNKTPQNLSIIFDESTFILPPNRAAAVISIESIMRQTGVLQPPILVPPTASASSSISAKEAGQFQISDLYPFPITEPLTIQLNLVLEINGAKQSLPVLFKGQP